MGPADEAALHTLVDGLQSSGYEIRDSHGWGPVEILLRDLASDEYFPLFVHISAMRGPEPEEVEREGEFAWRWAEPLPRPSQAELSGKGRTVLLGRVPGIDVLVAWHLDRTRAVEPSSLRLPGTALEQGDMIGAWVEPRNPSQTHGGWLLPCVLRPDRLGRFVRALPALAELQRGLDARTVRPEIAKNRLLALLGEPSPRPATAEAPAEEERLEEERLQEDRLQEDRLEEYRLEEERLEEDRLEEYRLAQEQAADYSGQADYSFGRVPPREPAPAREVSSGFAEESSARPLPAAVPLERDTAYLFWLEVGEPVEHSIELIRNDLQLDLIPEEASLDVALFSFAGGFQLDSDLDRASLRVTPDGRVLVERPAARPQSASQMLDRRLYFPVRTPSSGAEWALRCSIYCEGVLVQSRLVRAGPEGLSSELDYALSRSLRSEQLAKLPAADLSVMLNGDDHTHDLRFFAPATPEEDPIAAESRIDQQQLTRLIAYCRQQLRMIAWNTENEWDERDTPNYARRPTLELLEEHLVRLAIRGRLTYDKLFPELAGGREKRAPLERRMRHPGRVEIAADPTQFVPAAIFYDAAVETGTLIRKLSLCPDFAQAWKDEAPLLESQCFTGDCRHWDDKRFVCPSGFWGYRHSIGWPVSIRADALGVLPYPDKPHLSMACAPDLEYATQHERDVRNLLGDIAVIRDRESLLARLKARGDQVVYLYCHGGRTEGGAHYVRVEPPDGDDLTMDQIQELDLTGGSSLVFLNGCRTASLSPEETFELVSPFIEYGGALGVIGTEITVFEPMASRFALAFLRSFMREGVSVGEAVRRARLDALQWGNPLGLVYIPYILGGTVLDPPVAAGPPPSEAVVGAPA
jgi:hypothetical protein